MTMSGGGMGFALNPALDSARLAAEYAGRKRIQIGDFLDPASARQLADHLATTGDWRHAIKAGTQVFEASPAQMAAMDDAQKKVLDEAIFREAADGFRFRYDTIRVPDAAAERQRMATPVSAFAEFMTSPPVLDFFGRVTECDGLKFVDAQATRYRAGDFLTRHDDVVEGKNRSHAYVLGLTEEWRPEWGGLLLFNGRDGDIVEAMTPAFNTLYLFAVSQPHSVSYVAPYAARDRLSITGWLRTKRP
jgi:Rps23 Pro-64 3,4-dihydroxylase Tpa1-like proline 4-hydroxylase